MYQIEKLRRHVLSLVDGAQFKTFECIDYIKTMINGTFLISDPQLWYHAPTILIWSVPW